MVKIYKTLLARKKILELAGRVFNIEEEKSNSFKEQEEALFQPLLEGAYQTRICYLGGTILKEDLLRFERLIFRATRGKAYLKFGEMKITQ